ncbi:3-deoxy-D-manno-octulosonic acid transferase [Taibaiella sp. KBW10]|uniref:3-deoxy-D-manno-octulosonic acid transferase n=1 Tax=Taibaiella sp. KBW10 TaxID=2153357 RepID=UPI000F5AA55E|nr:glycosyltransferase N-terminal domain-containing protein [Taibaiella sp. KBW10]
MAGESRKSVWFHCASLGEFEQGRPVMEALKSIYPDLSIVLTFFSPSGYEVRKQYSGADYIYYLPLDTAAHARRFIALVQPKLAVFVKYEFWYHYLNTLHREHIHTIIISTIFQERHPFFKWYGGLHRRMLSYFDHLFVQTQSSVTLLQGIGIDQVTLAGDTRIDRALTIANTPKTIPEVPEFKQQGQLLIAGSTWPEDEQLLKDALSAISAKGVKLLIAPHEVNAAHIAQIQALFGADCCLISESSRLAQSTVAIVDSMGMLAYLYRYADYVWIGGGFNKTGIHNSIEAAVYGKALCWGPNYSRYQEALDLIALGAAHDFSSGEGLAAQIAQWQADEKKYTFVLQATENYVLQNKGATELILNYIATRRIF